MNAAQLKSGIDGGTINIGDQADVILVDPEKLKHYDGEKNVERIYRDEYQHVQLVNRSEGIVSLVMIAGKIAWQDEQFSQPLGKTKMGHVRLRKTAITPLTFA